jgi:hypothetical protein
VSSEQHGGTRISPVSENQGRESGYTATANIGTALMATGDLKSEHFRTDHIQTSDTTTEETGTNNTGTSHLIKTEEKSVNSHGKSIMSSDADLTGTYQSAWKSVSNSNSRSAAEPLTPSPRATYHSGSREVINPNLPEPMTKSFSNSAPSKQNSLAYDPINTQSPSQYAEGNSKFDSPTFQPAVLPQTAQLEYSQEASAHGSMDSNMLPSYGDHLSSLERNTPIPDEILAFTNTETQVDANFSEAIYTHLDAPTHLKWTTLPISKHLDSLEIKTVEHGNQEQKITLSETGYIVSCGIMTCLLGGLMIILLKKEMAMRERENIKIHAAREKPPTSQIVVYQV